jgi:hypothetical protein
LGFMLFYSFISFCWHLGREQRWSEFVLF